MRNFFLTILVFFALVVVGQPHKADALTVGPVKLEYSVDPGNKISGQLFLMNETSEAASFWPVFEKFTENNGERQFFPTEETELKNWFKAEYPITLKSKEQRIVPFTIDVPMDASPGGHFAVIWWSTAPPGESGKNVAIVTRAGILVYLRVSGDINESAEISSFKSSGRFFWGLPISFNTSFRNNGNVHLKPQGEIKIKNLFGMTKTALKFNPYGIIILPQSGRDMSSSWDSGFAFGPYKADIQIVYGESKKQISENLWIFIFPWKISLGVIIGLLLVFFGIPAIIKRYNRWIISRYSERK
jgi:hypothetical protein